MVVKILKEGFIGRRATCSHCGCEFAFDDEWLYKFCNREEKDRLYREYSANKYYILIQCPFCNNGVLYDTNKFYIGTDNYDDDNYAEKI